MIENVALLRTNRTWLVTSSSYWVTNAGTKLGQDYKTTNESEMVIAKKKFLSQRDRWTSLEESKIKIRPQGFDSKRLISKRVSNPGLEEVVTAVQPHHQGSSYLFQALDSCSRIGT